MNTKKLFSLFIAFLVIGLIQAQDLSVDEVIKRLLKAHNQEKFMRTENLKISGKANQQGMVFNMTIYQTSEIDYRMDMEIQGMVIIQALSGDKGWTINPMTGITEAQDMPPDMVKNLKDEGVGEAVLSWENPLYNYQEKGLKAVLADMVEISGKPAYNVELTLESGKMANYLVDAESFIVHEQYTTGSNMGQTFKGGYRFSDYREVDNIACPFKMEFLVNDQVVMTMTIDEVLFNVPIEESLFKKPEQ